MDLEKKARISGVDIGPTERSLDVAGVSVSRANLDLGETQRRERTESSIRELAGTYRDHPLGETLHRLASDPEFQRMKQDRLNLGGQWFPEGSNHRLVSDLKAVLNFVNQGREGWSPLDSSDRIDTKFIAAIREKQDSQRGRILRDGIVGEQTIHLLMEQVTNRGAEVAKAPVSVTINAHKQDNIALADGSRSAASAVSNTLGIEPTHNARVATFVEAHEQVGSKTKQSQSIQEKKSFSWKSIREGFADKGIEAAEIVRDGIKFAWRHKVETAVAIGAGVATFALMPAGLVGIGAFLASKAVLIGTAVVAGSAIKNGYEYWRDANSDDLRIRSEASRHLGEFAFDAAFMGSGKIVQLLGKVGKLATSLRGAKATTSVAKNVVASTDEASALHNFYSAASGAGEGSALGKVAVEASVPSVGYLAQAKNFAYRNVPGLESLSSWTSTRVGANLRVFDEFIARGSRKFGVNLGGTRSGLGTRVGIVATEARSSLDDGIDL